jgi:hypothetical protein
MVAGWLPDDPMNVKVGRNPVNKIPHPPHSVWLEGGPQSSFK